MKLSEFKKEALSDLEVRKKYEDLQPEFQIIEAIVEARYNKKLSQQDLADITGIDRADISKIENANANPTLDTLKRLAEGLGKKLVIEFK